MDAGEKRGTIAKWKMQKEAREGIKNRVSEKINKRYEMKSGAQKEENNMSAVNLTNTDFQEKVLQEERSALVDFWAPWCTHCRRISSAYDKIAEQYGDRLLVGKINIDEEPQLADRLQIEVIPTLMLFKNGKPVDSGVAPESKAQIEAFIQRNA